MDPLLGEAAQARAGPHQGGHEGVLSLPSSTLSSPWAWPHMPRPPVPSSGTSQDDALALNPPPHPPNSSVTSLMGCVYWTPLSPSTMLLYKAEEFGG